MNTNHLKALVATAKSAEGLYQQQASAMEFTLTFGEQLIKLVEAGQAMRDYTDIVIGTLHDQDYKYIPEALEELSQAWDALIKEDV